jgi:hypothetical protein
MASTPRTYLFADLAKEVRMELTASSMEAIKFCRCCELSCGMCLCRCFDIS